MEKNELKNSIESIKESATDITITTIFPVGSNLSGDVIKLSRGRPASFHATDATERFSLIENFQVDNQFEGIVQNINFKIEPYSNTIFVLLPQDERGLVNLAFAQKPNTRFPKALPSNEGTLNVPIKVSFVLDDPSLEIFTNLISYRYSLRPVLNSLFPNLFLNKDQSEPKILLPKLSYTYKLTPGETTFKPNYANTRLSIIDYEF